MSRYLSLGCGLQSSTIAEMIVEGDLPPIDFAVFADTGDEPQWVYDQRDYLEQRLRKVRVNLVTVFKENIIDAIMRKKGRFASIPAYTNMDGNIGMMRRQCTREYKIEPIEKFVAETLLEQGKAKRDKAGRIRVKKDAEAICIQGISLDEAVRMSQNKRPWITNEYPLVDLRMTRLDCANYLEKRNLPVPEKSSCRICPFHRNAYWKRMKEEFPDDWAHVVKVDNYLRGENNFTAGMKADMFLHRDGIPLEEVDFDKGDEQTDFFEICDGYCFV